MHKILHSARRQLGVSVGLALTLAILVSPAGAQTLDTLYSFPSLANGQVLPNSMIVINGVVYGTTQNGGTACAGSKTCGMVYSLTPPGTSGGAWTPTVLYSFTAQSGDGANPRSGLTLGSSILYGTTYFGGTGSSGPSSGHGTVYQLTPPATKSGTWTESVIFSFQGGPTGSNPQGGLAVGSSGVLYGTTYAGGAAGQGTVFQLSPPSKPGGNWTEKVLHNFAGGSDGSGPQSALLLGTNGTLYGVTFAGGSPCPNPGCGTVFQVTPPSKQGGKWTESVIYSFTGQNGDGSSPEALTLSKNGGLAGFTAYGGDSNEGTAFAMLPPSTPGGAWKEVVIHSFTGIQDGYYPYGLAYNSSSGTIYGTTTYGPGTAWGTVFSLAPPTTQGGVWTETTLHTFSNGSDGAVPGSLVLSKGMIFGNTYQGGASSQGTVFQMVP
jgi:uncharacterized repeat protein (TIGR03803 family)